VSEGCLEMRKGSIRQEGSFQTILRDETRDHSDVRENGEPGDEAERAGA